MNMTEIFGIFTGKWIFDNLKWYEIHKLECERASRLRRERV